LPVGINNSTDKDPKSSEQNSKITQGKITLGARMFNPDEHFRILEENPEPK
jgi:hypothetical protein